MAFDIDGIRRSVTIAEAASRFGVKLARDGRELKGCCPFHKDDTPSFTVFNGKDGVQRFHCFGCDAKGDVLEFTMKLKGVDLREAARILGGADGVPENRPPVELPTVDPYAGIEPVPFASHPFKVGVEVALYNPKRQNVSGFEPSHVHEYRDEDGKTYALVLRRTLPGGAKETPSVNRVKLPDGRVTWSRFPIRAPKLYGIERVAPAAQVIVVEGEKCADVWNAIPGRCAVSWPSGGQAWNRVDWSPLAGKDVIVWADHDEPGSKTMHGVAGKLADLGCRVRMIDTFTAGLDLPKGYDCADVVEAGGYEALYAFVREHLAPFVEPQPEPEQPAPEPELPPNVIPLSSRERPPQAPIEQLIQGEQTIADLKTRQEFLGEYGWRARLVTKATKDGGVEPKAYQNAKIFLQYHEDFAGLFVYDEALDEIIVMRRPRWDGDDGPWEPRALLDSDITSTRGWLEKLELKPTKNDAKDAIYEAAAANKINSLQDELRALQWDGVPRLETMFSRYCGANDTEYTRIAAKRFMVQAVRRALQPGCKAELMLILEGNQGSGKTTFCKIIAGGDKWVGEAHSIGGKDAEMALASKWIVEMPELVAHTKTDVERQKSFLSEQYHNYRPPYGTRFIKRPKQCVFIGTHNPKGNGYLKDETGARRFLPVAVGAIDFDALRADRDQIVAEAIHLLNKGEQSWLVNEEQKIAAVVQKSKSDIDPWTARFVRKASGLSRISIYDLMQELFLGIDRVDTRTSDRIIRCMKQAGWESYSEDGVICFRRQTDT